MRAIRLAAALLLALSALSSATYAQDSEEAPPLALNVVEGLVGNPDQVFTLRVRARGQLALGSAGRSVEFFAGKSLEDMTQPLGTGLEIKTTLPPGRNYIIAKATGFPSLKVSPANIRRQASLGEPVAHLSNRLVIAVVSLALHMPEPIDPGASIEAVLEPKGTTRAVELAFDIQRQSDGQVLATPETTNSRSGALAYRFEQRGAYIVRVSATHQGKLIDAREVTVKVGGGDFTPSSWPRIAFTCLLMLFALGATVFAWRRVRPPQTLTNDRRLRPPFRVEARVTGQQLHVTVPDSNAVDFVLTVRCAASPWRAEVISVENGNPEQA